MSTVTKKIDKANDLSDKGDWSDALDLLEKITEATPQEKWKITNLRAWIYWKQGEKTAARNLWGFVVDSKAKKAIVTSAHTGLSIYWAERDNKEKAIKHAKLALFLPPGEATTRDTTNLNGCAIAMAKIGELKKAEELFEEAASLNRILVDSDSPEIERKATHQLAKNCYNLATLIHLPQENWKKALAKLHQAIIGYKEVSAKTDEAAAHHRIAEVFENKRYLKKALTSETRSLQLWEEKKIPDRVEMAKKNIARIKAKITG